MSSFKKLYINDNHFLAYKKFVPNGHKARIGVVFLSGYMSDMEGGKAVFLQNLCEGINIPYVRFDYSGCGESSGNFVEGTISNWLDDTLSIIDDFTEVDQIILVGSSMGGWLMLLAAMKRKERIKSLLGIASAPDFTEGLMWDVFDEQVQKQIMGEGSYKMATDYCADPNTPDAEDSFYLITKDLILDGRKNMLLNKSEIDINIPMILTHGMRDEDVPFEYSIEIKERVTSKDVEVVLSTTGKHRMSEKEDLELIKNSLTKLLEN